MQQLPGHGAATDSKDGAASRQVVQRREVFGEPQRIPLRHDIEHCTKSQFGCLSRDPGRHEQAIGDDLVSLVLKVMLSGPERIKPESFSLLGRVHIVEGCIPTLLI